MIRFPSRNDGDDGLPSDDGIFASNPVKTKPTNTGICSLWHQAKGLILLFDCHKGDKI